MNRASLFFVLACVGGLAALPGCSQGPWAWLNPQKNSSDSAEPATAGGLAGLGGAKSDPKAPKNPFALARLSERQGQTGKAEQLYLEILKKSPDHAGAHHRLGVMYARQGKMPQAEEHFARALALKQDSGELLSDAGYFYYLMGRSQEAERLLRRALELEPGNRKYCTNLALAVADQGRRDEAYALFRQAGSEKEANANMAFVLAQQGEYQQALNLYDRVLTEDPSMRVAADAVIELSRRMEQKGQVAASQRAPNGGTVMASHAAASSDDAAALQRASALVTVSEGRPVPPPWAVAENPIAGPPSGPRAPIQADPDNARYASLPAGTDSAATCSPPEQRVGGEANPGIANGVPCAYVAPVEQGVAPPPRAKQAAALEAASNRPAEAAEAKSPLAGLQPAGVTGSSESQPEGRSASTVSLPAEWFHPAALALFLGMTLLGAGAFGWLRGASRQRIVSSAVARGRDGRGRVPCSRFRRRASSISSRRARP